MNRPSGSLLSLPAFFGVALVAAVVAGMLTTGLTVVMDRFGRPAIEVGSPVPRTIVVQIDGEVATPGVYRLPGGARMADVVAAAGGLTDDADVSSLNLAARVGDGETITLPPKRFATPVERGPAAGSPSAPVLRININTATAAELEALPDIGEVRAGRIVAYREEHGPFQSVDDLVVIDGIATTTMDELRPLVTTGDGR